MEIWDSAEVYEPAHAGLVRASQCVVPYLNSRLATSTVKDKQLEVRYIPIVMPVEMHDKYTERSRARIKQRVYSCAPQLDYETFVSGTFEQQVREFVRGLELSVPHLHKFGLSDAQVNEVRDIFAATADRIIEIRPDQTRH